MAEHSIPTQDGPAQVYMQNFAVIAANPGLYQLGAPDATAMRAILGDHTPAGCIGSPYAESCI